MTCGVVGRLADITLVSDCIACHLLCNNCIQLQRLTDLFFSSSNSEGISLLLRHLHPSSRALTARHASLKRGLSSNTDSATVEASEEAADGVRHWKKKAAVQLVSLCRLSGHNVSRTSCHRLSLLDEVSLQPSSLSHCSSYFGRVGRDHLHHL